MPKQIIPVPGAPNPNGHYSHAVRTGNLLYIAGQIPLDVNTGKLVEGDVEAQAWQVFKNLKTVLDAAGLDFSDIVKCHLYVDDMANFAVVNGVYREHFPTDPPARTTIQVAGLPLGSKVEIGAIAAFE